MTIPSSVINSFSRSSFAASVTQAEFDIASSTASVLAARKAARDEDDGYYYDNEYPPSQAVSNIFSTFCILSA